MQNRWGEEEKCGIINIHLYSESSDAPWPSTALTLPLYTRLPRANQSQRTMKITTPYTAET